MAAIARFLPIDNDAPELIDAEFEAGYEARIGGQHFYCTATWSWRPGWSDADMTIMQAQQT